MCGEMAGDPRYTPLLIGMGLQEFSMQPRALLEAKQTIRSLRAGPLREQVHALMSQIHQPGIEQRLAEVCPHRH